jgi:membrane-bound lytic murein transglycosylase D
MPGRLWCQSLPDMPDGNPLTEVALNRDIDLTLAARMAGLTEREFHGAQPRRQGAAGAGLGHAAPACCRKMPPAALKKPWPPYRQNRQLERAAPARTQPVDSIAARAGVTAAAVRAANDIPRGHKPLAGSTLLLPVAAPVGSRVSEEVVAAASLQTAPDVVKVQAKARAKETLAEAARRLAVDVNKLAQWNAVGAKRIKQPLAAGRYLTLWVPRERAGEFAPKMASPASKPVRKH